LACCLRRLGNPSRKCSSGPECRRLRRGCLRGTALWHGIRSRFLHVPSVVEVQHVLSSSQAKVGRVRGFVRAGGGRIRARRGSAMPLIRAALSKGYRPRSRRSRASVGSVETRVRTISSRSPGDSSNRPCNIRVRSSREAMEKRRVNSAAVMAASSRSRFSSMERSAPTGSVLESRWRAWNSGSPSSARRRRPGLRRRPLRQRSVLSGKPLLR